MAELHTSIVSLVSLAAGIASNHPDMGRCQLTRLRKLGVSEEHIAAAVEIARHIRDEAAQKMDAAFDEAGWPETPETDTPDALAASGASCCSATAGGHACC